eukprot:5278628-Amphidinium_carterae.4
MAAQSYATAGLRALSLSHQQRQQLGLASSPSNVKLHVHTDSASGKTMIHKLGISKKSKHMQLKHFHLQELVEQGVITLHKVSSLVNQSDILAKFMPQVTMTKHFNKVGIHEGTPEEINVQQLRAALNINRLGSSSTPD